jgi:hypothetical protein
MSYEDLWRRQLAFTDLALRELHGKPLTQLTDSDRQELTHEYIEALHSELVEVLGTTSWKRHRFVPSAGRDRLLEEIIDVQKYLWGLAQVWGVTPAELERAFNTKSDVVEQRFQQDHVLPAQVLNRKVVMVDIDDTVADWSNGFPEWVAKTEPSIKPDDYDKHNDPGLRQRLKERMFELGGMGTLRPLPGAIAAVQQLVREGYTVVWLTARNVNEHARLYADTVQWLRLHKLPTDYIYWSSLSSKHLFVLERLPMAVALFDDEPEVITHAKEFGIRAYRVQRDLGKQVQGFLDDVHGEDV